jgi:hypothetical protein
LYYAPHFPGNFLLRQGGVYDRCPDPLFLIPGKQGLISLPNPDLEVPVFIDIQGRPVFQPFQGNGGIKIKKNKEFRAGKTGVKLFRELISTGNALIHQGRKGKTVGNHQFPPAAALYNAFRSVNMLIPVRRKEPGQGFRVKGTFPREGLAYQGAYRALGGLKGAVKSRGIFAQAAA